MAVEKSLHEQEYDVVMGVGALSKSYMDSVMPTASLDRIVPQSTLRSPSTQSSNWAIPCSLLKDMHLCRNP